MQQHLQKTDGKTPNYRVASECGPDHSKTFTVHAMVGKKMLGSGTGKNKKEAEQTAAQRALEQLGVLTEMEGEAAASAEDAPNAELESVMDDEEPIAAEPAARPSSRRRVEFDVSGLELPALPKSDDDS